MTPRWLCLLRWRHFMALTANRVRQSNNFCIFRTFWWTRQMMRNLWKWEISTPVTAVCGERFATDFDNRLRLRRGMICTRNSIDTRTWSKAPTSQLAPSLMPSSASSIRAGFRLGCRPGTSLLTPTFSLRVSARIFVLHSSTSSRIGAARKTLQTGVHRHHWLRNQH